LARLTSRSIKVTAYCFKIRSLSANSCGWRGFDFHAAMRAIFAPSSKPDDRAFSRALELYRRHEIRELGKLRTALGFLLEVFPHRWTIQSKPSSQGGQDLSFFCGHRFAFTPNDALTSRQAASILLFRFGQILRQSSYASGAFKPRIIFSRSGCRSASLRPATFASEIPAIRAFHAPCVRDREN
jgi:hypothetical protein